MFQIYIPIIIRVHRNPDIQAVSICTHARLEVFNIIQAGKLQVEGGTPKIKAIYLNCPLFFTRDFPDPRIRHFEGNPKQEFPAVLQGEIAAKFYH